MAVYRLRWPIYRGQSIEIAMLLRRLHDGCLNEQGRLAVLATSATLGNGTEDAPEIAVFAENLFGKV